MQVKSEDKGDDSAEVEVAGADLSSAPRRVTRRALYLNMPTWDPEDLLAGKVNT